MSIRSPVYFERGSTRNHCRAACPKTLHTVIGIVMRKGKPGRRGKVVLRKAQSGVLDLHILRSRIASYVEHHSSRKRVI
jgi:hypothetical protein